MKPGTGIAILALVLATTAAFLPTLHMGFTREDWLFLWHALDPNSAPAGATGVFVRPLALGLWEASTWLTGDHPAGMHALMLGLGIAWGLATFAALRVRSPHPPTLLAVLAAAVVTHAALLESRLWASASNGLLAWTLATVALVVWSRHRPAAAILLILAGWARADALLLAFIPLADEVDTKGRGWTAALAAVVLVGVGLAGSHGVREFAPSFDHAGELVRRVLWPFGSSWSPAANTALGIAGMVSSAVAIWRFRGSARGCWMTLAALLAGSTLTPWAPAGRYVGVLLLALALWIARRPTDVRWLAPLLVAYVAVGIAATWRGSTHGVLVRSSAAETSLYEAVSDLDLAEDGLVLLDAPPMGWTGSTGDAENVVSCAMRRPIEVHFEPLGDLPALRFVQGAWVEP